MNLQSLNNSDYPLFNFASVNYYEIKSLGSISSSLVRKSTYNALYKTISYIQKTFRYTIQMKSPLSCVEPNVLDYIINNKLYGFSETSLLFSLQSTVIVLSVTSIIVIGYISIK